MTGGWIEFFPVDGTVGNLRFGADPRGRVVRGRPCRGRGQPDSPGERPSELGPRRADLRRVSFTHSPRHSPPLHRAARDRCLRRERSACKITSPPAQPRIARETGRISMSGDSPAASNLSAPPIDAAHQRVHLSSQLSRRHRRLPCRLADRPRSNEAINDQSGLLWVDIQGPDEHTGTHLENWLCDALSFSSPGRRRCTPANACSQGRRLGRLSLHRLSCGPDRARDSTVLELQELDIFLGKNYLITYHTVPLPILDQDRAEHRARSPRSPAAWGRPSLDPVPRAGDRPVA